MNGPRCLLLRPSIVTGGSGRRGPRCQPVGVALVCVEALLLEQHMAQAIEHGVRHPNGFAFEACSPCIDGRLELGLACKAVVPKSGLEPLPQFRQPGALFDYGGVGHPELVRRGQGRNALRRPHLFAKRVQGFEPVEPRLQTPKLDLLPAPLRFRSEIGVQGCFEAPPLIRDRGDAAAPVCDLGGGHLRQLLTDAERRLIIRRSKRSSCGRIEQQLSNMLRKGKDRLAGRHQMIAHLPPVLRHELIVSARAQPRARPVLGGLPEAAVDLGVQRASLVRAHALDRFCDGPLLFRAGRAQAAVPHSEEDVTATHCLRIRNLRLTDPLPVGCDPRRLRVLSRRQTAVLLNEGEQQLVRVHLMIHPGPRSRTELPPESHPETKPATAPAAARRERPHAR